MKKLLALAAFLLAIAPVLAFAQGRGRTIPAPGAIIEEEDGSPSVPLRKLIVPNGTLSDEGNAVVSIIFQTGQPAVPGLAGEFKSDDLTSQADGVKLAFTVSSNPVAGSMIAIIDGIIQRSGLDYSVGGNVVTFGTAPAADSYSLLFQYFFQDEADDILSSTNVWSGEQNFSSATVQNFRGPFRDEVDISTTANKALIDAILTGLATPVFASSRVVNIPITTVGPAFQSISTTTVILKGGRPFFIIVSLEIFNEAPDRTYEIRFLIDGIQEGVTVLKEVDGSSHEIISFHLADANSITGTHNFTLEINTTSTSGNDQTVLVSRVTVVEM